MNKLLQLPASTKNPETSSQHRGMNQKTGKLAEDGITGHEYRLVKEAIAFTRPLSCPVPGRLPIPKHFRIELRTLYSLQKQLKRKTHLKYSSSNNKQLVFDNYPCLPI